MASTSKQGEAHDEHSGWQQKSSWHGWQENQSWGRSASSEAADGDDDDSWGRWRGKAHDEHDGEHSGSQHGWQKTWQGEAHDEHDGEHSGSQQGWQKWRQGEAHGEHEGEHYGSQHGWQKTWHEAHGEHEGEHTGSQHGWQKTWQGEAPGEHEGELYGSQQGWQKWQGEAPGEHEGEHSGSQQPKAKLKPSAKPSTRPSSSCSSSIPAAHGNSSSSSEPVNPYLQVPYETYDAESDDDDIDGAVNLNDDEAPKVEGCIDLVSDADEAPMEDCMEDDCDEAAMIDYDIDESTVDALYDELVERHGARRRNDEGRIRNAELGRKCSRGTKRRGGAKQRKQELRAQLGGNMTEPASAMARRAIAPHRVKRLLAEL